jgi:hypothetical protein
MILGLEWMAVTGSLAAQNYHGKRNGKQTHYEKSFFSFLFPLIKGSGVPLSNDRVVKPFHAIVVEDPFRVVIRQGSPYQVRVVSDDNLPEFIHTTVSDDGVLTIAMDVKNYEYDTLSVFITAPTFDAITLGLATKVIVEAPFSVDYLKTTLAGIGCDMTFLGGVIRKHSISADGIGSSIDAASVQSEEVKIQMPGIGADARIKAAQIEPIGNFGIGATLRYALYEGKPPEIVGSEGKGLGAQIKPLQEPTTPSSQKKPTQAPLPVPIKN